MTLADALYLYLTSASSLTTLIATRVYPAPLPQRATLPAVTYMQVSGPMIRTMGGRQGRSPRYQFDCWGETRATARAVAEALIARLDHYSGEMAAGVTVRGAFLEADIDDYEPETKRYRAILDFVIHHEEIA